MPRAIVARCGECGPCLNPKWKKRCARDAPPADAASKRPCLVLGRREAVEGPAPLSEENTESLARLLGVEPTRVGAVRRSGELLSLADVACLVTGQSSAAAGRTLKRLRDAHPEWAAKCHMRHFPGARAGSPCLVGDIYAVVEMVMLLPCPSAALVRGDAARKIVRVYGGSLELASEIIARRERQDVMRAEHPEAPEHIFGKAVDREEGTVDQQRQHFEEHLRTNDRQHNEKAARIQRGTYDASRFTEVHHRFKDECNARFIENALRLFGGSIERVLEQDGHVLVLDDCDARGRLRTIAELLRAGVPAERILSPNTSADMVEKLKGAGVLTACKHVNRALAEDFASKRVSVAYLDGCTGNVEEIKQMVYAALRANRAAVAAGSGAEPPGSFFTPLALGYTLVGRDFTQGGGLTFTQRVLNLVDHMKDLGFEPLVGSFTNSYVEFSDGAQRVCTAFWRKRNFCGGALSGM
jgi:hypothetical protein